MADIRHLENRLDVIFSTEGGPIWISFRRLLNDMSTAVIWSKSKPDVEFQYGGRLGEFHGMSSHCRVLPLREFTVMISEPHAILHGAVTWRNQYHDCATLQGVIIPSFFAIFYFIVFNAVWASTSGGFRIVSDNLVAIATPSTLYLKKLDRYD